jgi:hypothetical protein
MNREDRQIALLRAIQYAAQNLPAEWDEVKALAIANGLLTEAFELTDSGRQYLESRSEPLDTGVTLTKISLASRLKLKELAEKRGVTRQEALDELIASAE